MDSHHVDVHLSLQRSCVTLARKPQSVPYQRRGRGHSPERPVVPLPDLIRLLVCVPARYRAMLLLATFADLRFGELAALRRPDLDLDHCVVRVVRSTAQMNDGKLIEQEPKSRAGRRTVAVPREIADELRWHLERFAEPGDDGLVFVGPLGGRLRRSNFRDLWRALLAMRAGRARWCAGRPSRRRTGARRWWSA